ncbi:MAG: cytochrome c peroxidase [Planctomycetota bacterium]
MKSLNQSLILLCAFAITTGAFAQFPQNQAPDRALESEATIQQRLLGQFLFRSTDLSLDGSQSCATCHREDRSFTDGLVEPPGILGTGGGRNTPTLIAMAHVSKFPGPTVSKKTRSLVTKVMTLEERCLAPIENPLEMASSLKSVLVKLRGIEGMKAKFNAAFGQASHGVTEARLGKALAAYVASLKPRQTRFHRYLAGDTKALSEYERHGYSTFIKNGCGACHHGMGLSDGLMHVAFVPNSRRALRQVTRANEIAFQARAEQGARSLRLPQGGLAKKLFDSLPVRRQGGMCGTPSPQRGGYGGGTTPGQAIEMQTLTLWDVKRTAPYFRDGSEPDLTEAVALHIRDLKEVKSQRRRITEVLSAQSAAGNRPPRELRVSNAFRRKLKTAPDFSSADLDAMIAFLKTLSPGARVTNKPRFSKG